MRYVDVSSREVDLGQMHLCVWYDISLRDSKYDERVCTGCLNDTRLGCGARQHRVRVDGVRLGSSYQPWLSGEGPRS
jgi:hypothetical protein